MTDKVVSTSFVELGHAIPAVLTPQRQREAARLTARLLDAVGLTDGPSHTELEVTTDGLRIVESPNRVGGANIVDLVHDVYGVDFERFTIGTALGAATWHDPVLPECGGSAIRYLTSPPGVVRSVRAPDVESLPAGVSLYVGVRRDFVVPPLRWSLDRVCGYVRAVGPSAQSAMARCEAVLEMIGIEVSNEDHDQV